VLCGSEAPELPWDRLEMLCGARVTSNYVRIGGVKHGMPPDFPASCRKYIAKTRELLHDFDDVITSNRIFVDRLKGTGVIDRETCIRYAVTGPILRSTGGPLDLRQQAPYPVYDQLDFDVPGGPGGHHYDRHLLSVEEMHQSLRIVEQCLARLEQLGPGPVNVFDPRVRWPAKGRVFNRMEELIQQFKSVTEGPRVPAGEGYFALESANGEL